MSDVIFAGVEGRAAKSLASVELIFEHTQDETHGIRHELNLYQELSLRRQVTKEGSLIILSTVRECAAVMW